MTQFADRKPFVPEETPLLILAEGCFGMPESKMAIGVIRYGKWPISAVLDSQLAGKTVNQVVKSPCEAPIVSSITEAMACSPKPKAVLVGTAPIGGGLSEAFRQPLEEAVRAGLHIISGLHVFLNRIPSLKALADEHGVKLWDVRDVEDVNIVARQLPRPPGTKVITMVGTDCSVGKMSAGLELYQTMQQQGLNTGFVATGQTGIMITGSGVPLDRVIGDFMAGYIEREIDMTLKASSPEWIIVEGQGSLLHPAYSGVTMSLLHGSAPDAMILCHNPIQKTIKHYPLVPLPDLKTFVRIYEDAAAWIKPAKILGVALNTSAFSDEEAQAFIREYEVETGLPVTDPVRYGAEKLVQALTQAF